MAVSPIRMKLAAKDSRYKFSPMKVVLFLIFLMLIKQPFVAINSCIILEQSSNQKPVPSHWTTILVYKTGCVLLK